MEAEKKAKELVDKFMPWASGGMEDSVFEITQSAKQCALICVEEIVLELDGFCNDDGYQLSRLDYWKSVKEQIENL